MRAFVVDHYGRDGLREAELPMPPVGLRDVLVDIRAASVNPLDVMIHDGEFKQVLNYPSPFTLGHDVAGIVTEVGADVQEFEVGDEIWARPRDHRIGTFAEFIAIDAADVALKPASLSFAEAAAVPLVALAAWQALVDVAQVRPGQRVLVHAGAGGLGSTGIQLARHLGAHVATTARGTDTDAVTALGADEVVDFTTTDFSEVLSDFDVVLDSAGAENLKGSMAVLKPGGLVISVVGPPDPSFATQVGKPLLKPVMALLSLQVRRRARRLGVRYSFFFMRADGAQLATSASLYDAGVLRPILDRTFDFDQTPEAVAHLEQGKAHGKVVITR